MANVRYIAYKVLYRVLREDAYSAIALNTAVHEENLSGVDVSFLSALVYGVLERKLTLEYIIRQYSSVRIKKIEAKTLIVLYLGMYQLVWMDKVPDSAAVNESVKLCKQLRLYKSAGFVNAVLRNFIRADKQHQLPNQSDQLRYLSVVYSCPESITQELLDTYGDDLTEQILKGIIGRPPITVRVNTLKTDKEKLITALKEQGIKAESVPYLVNSLFLSSTGSLDKIPQFQQGHFFVEDAASQLCAEILDAQPGERVADVCAAPGGKSLYTAVKMENRGEVFSYDIHEHKIKLMEDNAKRLGVTIMHTAIRDAASSRELPECQRILCDVPCSGWGILRRKPEIRYKSDTNIDILPKLQYSILCMSAEQLPTDGVLVYSTCTLRKAENHDVIKRFLEEHPQFTGEALNLPDGIDRVIEEEPYCLTLLPGAYNTDGFFIAKLRRVRYD
ncbi:MAG: 16S rRNA (cytosine(967)-C(5))-methyltransferase RsmB [Ruminococcus sp.]|uniref:16S rRNA (cytosine(967)-C(5))-methyltransferase RsmB n=1 Tax=Ruminococcus sp. TaxID=41978 RepID=UPI00287336C1|nr:16S rRNA (cytosine(967)-C(5))-methyltransferase RsmB [Ruminococcus sp.]MBQ3285952.1 16S rRNA (cytosine(967)-C(5))-methyltransferase RsmB [Ruminococcus sp.]